MEHKKNNDCNRNIFAQMVLPAFVCAYIWGSDIRTVYSKFVSKLNSDANNDHRAQNDERRKILENCLTFFTDIKMKKEIEAERQALKKQINESEHRGPDYEREPSHSELAKRIISVFPEKLFGDNKRKYDMSYLYDSGTLKSFTAPDGTVLKLVKVVPVNGVHLNAWSFLDDYGRIISLNLIGRLEYKNGFGSHDYLGQYRVSISKENVDEDEYIVYSNIDMNRIGRESQYSHLILQELLSKNNIELSNSSGYIGEIIDTPNPNLSVGEELYSDDGFYRYQVSPNFALSYDSEQLSAVVDYVKQQELLQQKIVETDSGAR